MSLMFGPICWMAIFATCVAKYDGDTPEEKEELFVANAQRLTNALFSNYDATLAPIYTGFNLSYEADAEQDQPPRFNISNILYYIKLVEVDEPQEKVSFVIELITYWYDRRLKWNRTDYGGIQKLYVTASKVWIPPIQPFGPNDYVEFEDESQKVCQINYGTDVTGYVSVKISSICPMKVGTQSHDKRIAVIEVENFPFDSQICKVQLGSPYFAINEIKLYSSVYQKILDESIISTMGNSEWSVVSLSDRVEVVDYNDDFGSTELIVYEIHLKRNPVYYVYMIIIPSFLINTVSIVGVFLLGADKMSRLNVGLTNIMTMTFIMGVMADKIPKTHVIPLLGIYIIINLAIMLVALSCMFTLNTFRASIRRRQKDKNHKYWNLIESLVNGSALEYSLIIILEIWNLATFIGVMAKWN